MEYLPVVSIIIAISGFLYQQFAIISGLRERITSLETKMGLFWKAIEGNVASMLKTYPTNIDKDILLDKLTQDELGVAEAERLRTVLIAEMERARAEDRLVYILIIARLEQLLYDVRKAEKRTRKSLWSRIFCS